MWLKFCESSGDARKFVPQKFFNFMIGMSHALDEFLKASI